LAVLRQVFGIAVTHLETADFDAALLQPVCGALQQDMAA
jgi:hypothetical protein